MMRKIFFFILAAPSQPNIRGLGDITLTHEKYLPTLRRDIEDAIFPQRVQKKIKKNRLAKLCCNKFIYYLARWVIAQTNRYGSIGVELNKPTTEEEKLKKQRINKQALDECIETVQDDIPLVIAPSAGKTYETNANPSKSEKVEFVKNLQQVIYNTMKKDEL